MGFDVSIGHNKRQDIIQQFKSEAEGYRDQKRKFWMKRFDDEVIRNPEMMRTKLEYLHSNPVKALLVEKPEDYKYSSARNYILGDQSVLVYTLNGFECSSTFDTGCFCHGMDRDSPEWMFMSQWDRDSLD